MNTKDRIKLYAAITLLFCAAGIALYRYGAPTDIAFVNYPEYMLSSLLRQEPADYPKRPSQHTACNLCAGRPT